MTTPALKVIHDTTRAPLTATERDKYVAQHVNAVLNDLAANATCPAGLAVLLLASGTPREVVTTMFADLYADAAVPLVSLEEFAERGAV